MTHRQKMLVAAAIDVTTVLSNIIIYCIYINTVPFVDDLIHDFVVSWILLHSE